MADEENGPLGDVYPYAERFGVQSSIPEQGRSREDVLAELETMASEEDDFWQTGQCSGTMYCGDTAHYEFLNKTFALFAHVNALQRDICPSLTRFEGEITAMALDFMNGGAVGEHHPDESPRGSVTSGGSESISTAVLMYRDKARADKGIANAEMILPETAHPAFEKAAHLYNVKVIHAPVHEDTTLVDLDFVRANINENTVMLVGSAGNYPYGTIDPISELSEIALANDIGLHVDGCLGGFILPWGEQLGYDIPVFDFRLPGVTTISADTHKYGYGLKGTSVLLYRDKSFRDHVYFMTPDWKGGKYNSPGIAGSRSGGLIAATWASMVTLGKDGYKRYAKAIFETAFKMQDIVKSHEELQMMGDPTFCFSFTSDRFDIYHLNDFMVTKGWRFNGQQYPNAIHMCVTRPQTQAGVVEKFEADLADAVKYALAPALESPKSGAIYGGVPKEIPGVDELVKSMLVDYLDGCSDLPAMKGA